ALIAVAVTAILGGIVAAGSNHSTAKEAMHELTVAEAKRTALIEQIDLRTQPGRATMKRRYLDRYLLSEAKRTLVGLREMSAYDPKRTSWSVRLTDIRNVYYYSAAIFANLITLAHFSVSSAIRFP